MGWSREVWVPFPSGRSSRMQTSAKYTEIYLDLDLDTVHCTLYTVQSSGVETGFHTASLQSLTAKIQLPAILTSRLYQVTPMKHECGAACSPTPSFESVTSINKASHTFIYMALAIKECSRATWSLRGFKLLSKERHLNRTSRGNLVKSVIHVSRGH